MHDWMRKNFGNIVKHVFSLKKHMSVTSLTELAEPHGYLSKDQGSVDGNMRQTQAITQMCNGKKHIVLLGLGALSHRLFLPLELQLCRSFLMGRTFYPPSILSYSQDMLGSLNKFQAPSFAKRTSMLRITWCFNCFRACLAKSTVV